MKNKINYAEERQSFCNETLRPLSAPPIMSLLNTNTSELVYQSYYTRNHNRDVRLPLPAFFFTGQSYLSSYFYNFNDCKCNNCEFCTYRIISDIKLPKKTLTERINEDFPSEISPHSGPSRCTTPIGKKKEPINTLFNQLIQFAYINKPNLIQEETINSEGILLLCKDQEASRFIQKRLEIVSIAELDWLFDKISNHLIDLSRDLFGNYIVQKYISSHGEIIYDILRNRLSILSFDIYGCRVVQKLLDFLYFDLEDEFLQDIIELTKDQNGNHVIQKIIEVGKGRIDFLIKEFEVNAIEMCKHKYGCRAIQRLFEFVKFESTNIINNILLKLDDLIYDQFGNYVIQHLLDYPDCQPIILNYISSNVMKMSCHKFASNVIEKCINSVKDYSGIVDGVIEKNNLVVLTNSGFGNYVLQRLIEKKNVKVCESVRENVGLLRRCVYYKQVVSKLGL